MGLSRRPVGGVFRLNRRGEGTMLRATEVSRMARVLLNLDVDDIERAVAFYTQGLDLSVGRRFDSGFVELLGAEAPIYLLLKAAGTAPFEGPPPTARSY